MEKKLKITYNEANVLGSVPYILVKEFDLVPNILKADIDGDGSGVMIIEVTGDEKVINEGIRKIEECGYKVGRVENHISKDDERCWHCGACVSQCPTHAITEDKSSFEVKVIYDKCIACGSCVNACSVKALKLVL